MSTNWSKHPQEGIEPHIIGWALLGILAAAIFGTAMHHSSKSGQQTAELTQQADTR